MATSSTVVEAGTKRAVDDRSKCDGVARTSQPSTTAWRNTRGFLVRSDAPRVDNNNNSTNNAETKGTKSKSKHSSSSSVDESPTAERSSAIYEGESRRLRRTVRATLELNYYLHSLRIPWKQKGVSTSSESLLVVRHWGKLYSNSGGGRFLSVVSSLLSLLEDPDTTTDVYHRASIVLDTCLPHWHIRALPVHEADTDPLEPVFQDSLVDYQGIIHAVMFRNDTPSKPSRYHIVCKLFPRAGMPRRFTPILLDYMRNDIVLKREITEIILCSVLGNFTHCPRDSRADMNMRLVFYGTFMPLTFRNWVPQIAADRIIALFHRGSSPLLPFFALREYLVASIDSDPLLRKHASAILDYEVFRTIVIDAMAAVRIYIRRNLMPGGSMTATTIETDVHVNALDVILERSYDAVVKRSPFRKPRPMPFDLLKSARGRLPPSLEWAKRVDCALHYCSAPTSDEKCSITRSRTRAAKRRLAEAGTVDDNDDGGAVPRAEKRARRAKNNQDNEENTNDDQPHESVHVLLGQLDEGGVADGRLMRDILREVGLDDETNVAVPDDSKGRARWEPSPHNTPCRSGSRAITRECIFVEHSEAICAFVRSLDPGMDGVDAFNAVLGYLPHLGGAETSLAEHRELGIVQHTGVNTLRSWEERIKHLGTEHPYTYNLVQAAASAWVAHSAIRSYKLPHHYVEAQVAAISQRFEIDQETECYLPDQPCRLMFCRVCRRISTIVRKRPQPPKKKGKRPKPIPTHGYVDVTVDLATGLTYCSKNRSWMHERCGEEPLSEVTIIGNVIRYGGHTYIICGQPACGHIAILHPIHTIHTEYGAACYSCSLAIRNKRAAISPAVQQVRDMLNNRRVVRKHNRESKDELKKKDVVPAAPRCFLCDRVINSEMRLFLYGVATYICALHPLVQIRTAVTAGMVESGYTAEITCDVQAEATIRELLLKFVAEHKEMFQRTWDRINKAMKARRRAAAETARILR